MILPDTNPLTNFFPVEPEPVQEPMRVEPTPEELDEMARAVLQDAMGMPDDTEVPSKFIYEAYRKVDDLPPTAKAFYGALGDYFPTLADNPLVEC